MKKSFAFFFIFLTFLAILRLFLFFSEKVSYRDSQEISLQTRILSDPKIQGSTQRITVHLRGGKNAFVYLPLYPEIRYGDLVRIEGRLKIKKIEDGEIIFINFPKAEKVEDRNWAIKTLADSREKIITSFQRVLPIPSSSLLLGIVFGIKESFPKEFDQDLREVGVMHVIAASGMNVAMLGGILSSFFISIFKRQTAIILTIFGIVLYAFISGLEPSIIRASLMGALAFSAQLIGRQSLSVLSLYFSALIMLILNPGLIFDIGFQLSFMATLGIISFKPEIDTRFKKKVGKLHLLDDISTTIVAQVFTLPILIHSFGVYSLWSILVNALVLWTVPILMLIGGIASVLIFISSFFSIFLYLALPFLIYFERIVGLFGNLDGQLDLSLLPWQYLISYYLILFAFLLRLKKII